MAKLALILVAAFALQAAVAGVVDLEPHFFHHHHHHHEHHDADLRHEMTHQLRTLTGDFKDHLKQLTTISSEDQRALREFALEVDLIVTKLQRWTTLGHVEVDMVMQRLTGKLREVLVPLMRLIESETWTDAKQFTGHLIGQLFAVVGQFEQLEEVCRNQNAQVQSLIKELFAEYRTALEKMSRTEGKLEHESFDLYRHQRALGSFNKMGLYEKADMSASPMGLDLLLGAKHATPMTYGKMGRGLGVQIQTVVEELSVALENVHIENTYVRHILMNLIRVYALNLQTIVGTLEQHTLTAGDQFMLQQLNGVVTYLRQLDLESSSSPMELRQHLVMHIQLVANEFEKLFQQNKDSSNTLIGNLFVQFLTVTRNLQMQIRSMAVMAQGATTGFAAQIHTIANGLTTALQAVSMDNKQTRVLLQEQIQEFVKHLENLMEKLQVVNYGSMYTTNVPLQVAANLKQVLLSLRQMTSFDDMTTAQEMKMRYTMCIHDAVTQMQQLWLLQEEGRGQLTNVAIREILNDFVGILQNQWIQLQHVFQYRQYGQSAQELVMQIQAVTNNMAVYLQNAQMNGEFSYERVEMHLRALCNVLYNMMDRLEVALKYTMTTDVTMYHKLLTNFRQQIAVLESLTESTSTDLRAKYYHLFTVLQNISMELKKFAWMEQSTPQMNFDDVLRSVLVEYLIVLQNMQMQLQRMNETVYVAQSPRELALRMQVVADNLSRMLRLVPVNKMTQNTLIWEVRRLNQLINIIVMRMENMMTTGLGKMDVYQQVLINLKQMHSSFEQMITEESVESIYQLKIQLAMHIQNLATELQKLMWLNSTTATSMHGDSLTFVRTIFTDFLSCLQDMHMQMQDGYQFVMTGQNPKALTMQMHFVANRLASLLQWAQPADLKWRQVLIVQIAEFAETLENMIQLLQTEMKTNLEHLPVLKEISQKFAKISLALQQLTGSAMTTSASATTDLGTQFNKYLEMVLMEIEQLAMLAESKVQSPALLSRPGVLNGLFNNFLATLRNMLIQMQNIHQFDTFAQNTQEMAGLTQTLTNNIVHRLDSIVSESRIVKQALVIQALRYVHHLELLAERMQMELMVFGQTGDVTVLKEIPEHLRLAVVALRQMATSVNVWSITDLKSHFNTQIQNVDAQIQKFMLWKQTHETIAVKCFLIDYLACLRNMHIQIDNIWRMSQQGQNMHSMVMQIENTMMELFTIFSHPLPMNTFFEQTINTEIEQFVQLISEILAKLEAFSGVGGNTMLLKEMTMELRQIQTMLRQMTNAMPMAGDKMHLMMLVRRATTIIENLMWVSRPEYPVHFALGTSTTMGHQEIFAEFLSFIQNMLIKMESRMDLMRMRMPMDTMPKQTMVQMQSILNNLFTTMQGPMTTTQKQLCMTYVRYFDQMLATFIMDLEQHMGTKSLELGVILSNLREIHMELKKITMYTTGAHSEEIMQCLRTLMMTCERMMTAIEGMPQSGLSMICRQFWMSFCEGLRKLCMEMQTGYGYNKYAMGGDLSTYRMMDKSGYYPTLMGKTGLNGYKYGNLDVMGNKMYGDELMSKYPMTYKNNAMSKYSTMLPNTKWENLYGNAMGGSKYGMGLTNKMLNGAMPKYPMNYESNLMGKYDTMFNNKYGMSYNWEPLMTEKYDKTMGKYGMMGMNTNKYGMGLKSKMPISGDFLMTKHPLSYETNYMSKYSTIFPNKYDTLMGGNIYGMGSDNKMYGSWDNLMSKRPMYYENMYNTMPTGSMTKYGANTFADKWGMYHQDQTLPIFNELRVLTKEVARYLEAMPMDTMTKDMHQMIMYQTRQLIQIVEILITKVQEPMHVANLRMLQKELMQIVQSGMFTGFYQLVEKIEMITMELERLMMTYGETATMDEILMQYFYWLRTTKTQLMTFGTGHQTSLFLTTPTFNKILSEGTTKHFYEMPIMGMY